MCVYMRARVCVCVCVDEYVCLLRVCGLVGVTPLLSGVGMLDALYFNRSVLDPKCLLHDGVYMELFEKIYIYVWLESLRNNKTVIRAVILIKRN